MGYFDNQNRVRLITKPGSHDSGQFEFKRGGEPVYRLDTFKAVVLGVRDMAVEFSAPINVYYDRLSPGFQDVMRGNFTEGSWGYEVALKYDGQVYILFLHTAGTRPLVERLREAIGQEVMFGSVLAQSSEHSWYTIDNWFRS